MNRVLHWLIWKMAHPLSTRETNKRESDDAEGGAPVVDNNEHANVDELMPDIYGQASSGTPPGDEIYADDDTQPVLQIVENPAGTDELSEGFDPYNSGDYRLPKK